MGLTEAERAELAVLAANIRDDRTRGLIFKLLELEPARARDEHDAHASRKATR